MPPSDDREQGDEWCRAAVPRPARCVFHRVADSAVGQAAWLYDIFDSGSGRTGDPDRLLGREAMLDEITAYWLASRYCSFASSINGPTNGLLA